MKKLYVQPNTENVVLNLGEQITWGEEVRPSVHNPYNTGDAKQNVIIFEEFMDEEPDTTDFWSNDPWKIQYSLWDEE